MAFFVNKKKTECERKREYRTKMNGEDRPCMAKINLIKNIKEIKICI